jgi:hypothetical protein
MLLQFELRVEVRLLQYRFCLQMLHRSLFRPLRELQLHIDGGCSLLCESQWRRLLQNAELRSYRSMQFRRGVSLQTFCCDTFSTFLCWLEEITLARSMRCAVTVKPHCSTPIVGLLRTSFPSNTSFVLYNNAMRCILCAGVTISKGL